MSLIFKKESHVVVAAFCMKITQLDTFSESVYLYIQLLPYLNTENLYRG